MGQDSKISWTHDSWSPWHGCVEVDPACDNCYARVLSRRFGYDVWGKDAPRRFFGQKHWHKPYELDQLAERTGEQRRVFPSMCDPFEVYSGVSQSAVSQWPMGGNVTQPPVMTETRAALEAARGDFWQVIKHTPHLDWLLLTKRPDAIHRLAPKEWVEHGFPPNVWLGVTIANKAGYWRWHALSQLKAAVRFVSYEPALEPIAVWEMCLRVKDLVTPDWVIIGGESDQSLAKARPFDIATMARPLMEECRALKIPVWFKQYGSHGWDSVTGTGTFKSNLVQIQLPGKGEPPADGNWYKARYPSDLMVQELPR